jgi:hypothetical protein
MGTFAGFSGLMIGRVRERDYILEIKFDLLENNLVLDPRNFPMK